MSKKRPLFLLALLPLLIGTVLFSLRERTKIASAEISSANDISGDSVKPMHCRLAKNEARQLYKALVQDDHGPSPINGINTVSNGAYWYRVTFYNSSKGVLSKFLIDLEFGEVKPQNKHRYNYMMSKSPFDAVKQQVSSCGR